MHFVVVVRLVVFGREDIPILHLHLKKIWNSAVYTPEEVVAIKSRFWLFNENDLSRFRPPENHPQQMRIYRLEVLVETHAARVAIIFGIPADAIFSISNTWGSRIISLHSKEEKQTVKICHLKNAIYVGLG